MSFLEQFERRLGRSDMIQLLTLFLVVLAFMTLARWANPLSRVNEAWFSVSQTRVILLALIALGYGGAYALRPRPVQRSTGLAVLMFALVSTPFEVAAYAASYPSVPLGWALLLPLVDTVAFYGIGLGLGWFLSRVRSRSLLPLAIPGLLIGMVALDIRLGVNLLNPMTASVNPAWQHAGIMIAIASLTTVLLALRPESGASR